MSSTEIYISKPQLQRRYHIAINGGMLMGGVENNTKVETECLLNVLEIDSNKCATIELITLDTDVIETGNQAFRELSVIANQLKKVTQDIVCVIDKEGKVLRVVNTEQIKRKWGQLKSEMVSICGRSGELTDFFNINEKLFCDQDTLKQYVGEMEFFKIHFNGLYGHQIRNKEHRETDNTFKTNKISYNLYFDNDEDDELIRIRFEGRDFEINHDWLQKSYGQMPFVDLRNMKPEFTIQGDYLIEKTTGLIKGAKFVWDENISKELHLRTEYIITEKRR
jgi:hypothetical protein